MNNFIENMKKELPAIGIRVDRKDLINQLRALQGTLIEIHFNPDNPSTLLLMDRNHQIYVKTRM